MKMIMVFIISIVKHFVLALCILYKDSKVHDFFLKLISIKFNCIPLKYKMKEINKYIKILIK